MLRTRFPSEIYNRILTVWLGKSRNWQTFLLAVVLPVRCNKISREEYSMNLAVPSAGPALRGGLVVLISHKNTYLLWERLEHFSICFPGSPNLPNLPGSTWDEVYGELWELWEEEMELKAIDFVWGEGRSPVFPTFGVGLTDTATPLVTILIAIVRINDSAKLNRIKYK